MSAFPYPGDTTSTAAPIVRQVPSGYQPPQWSSAAMVSITVPASTSTINVGPINMDYSLAGTINADPNIPITTAAHTYVFDAVLSLEHNQTLTITKHPVQNSAAISSHAYLNPASLVMYVLMSDVVGNYPGATVWTGGTSKSVSSYQQMLALQAARSPLTVVTRLRTYTNMLVAAISPHEDAKTITGARFRVEFEQIFLAGVQITPASASPNDTNTTGLGTVSAYTPPATINSQFLVPPGSMINTLNGSSTAVPTATTVDVPGAGLYTSSPQQFGVSNPAGAQATAGLF
jgi:hypothetical protein